MSKERNFNDPLFGIGENMKIDLDKNTIVCGDNDTWLKDIPNNSIDLCYIDPPFFSNATYEIIWGNGAEVASFGDRFAGGIQHYIDWMRPRIEQIHRVLKDTGSIFLHCDWHASHRLRCLLDEVFGENSFKNEIIWHYGQRMMHKIKHINRKHDNIFWYTKNPKKYKFNQITEPYDSFEEIRSWRGTKFDGQGEEYYEADGGRNKPRYRRYLKDIIKEGKAVCDVWHFRIIGSKDKERLGYKTQKPLKLIERIINCATDENDLVLDCFAGGFTTANACANLNRKFICGDVSPVACKIGSDRIFALCPETDFDIKGLPRSIKEFKGLSGNSFAELICDVMGWDCNPLQTGDGGKDAWDGNRNPIEIKNGFKNSVGRPVVQKLHSRIISDKKKYGAIVGWNFSRQAIEYVAELKNEHGVTIELKDAEKILAPLILPEERSEKIQKLYEERKPKFQRDDSYNESA